LAKKTKVEKWKRHKRELATGTMKYPVQFHNRRERCGRPRGYIRFVGMCRICFRSLALRGELPGIRKASL